MRRTILAVLVGLGLLGPGAASAQGSAKCAVRVIQASHEGQGIDPKIDRLKPFLEKDPFTAWKRFQLLEERDVTVSANEPSKFPLPNGKQASLTFVEHVQKEGGKHRLRLRLEVEDGQKKVLNTTFLLDEGGVVLQAGQKLQNGLLILGVSCESLH